WNSAKHIKHNNTKKKSYAVGLYDNAALRLSKYFQKNFEKIHFEITIARSQELLIKLNNGLLDICVCILPDTTAHLSNIVLIGEFSERLVPVSGKIWSEKPSKLPFILYNKDSETQRYIDQAFLKHRIKPQVVVESSNPAFMKELAIGKCGVALLPENFVRDEIKREKLYVQPFSFQFERTMGVFIQKGGLVDYR